MSLDVFRCGITSKIMSPSYAQYTYSSTFNKKKVYDHLVFILDLILKE